MQIADGERIYVVRQRHQFEKNSVHNAHKRLFSASCFYFCRHRRNIRALLRVTKQCNITIQSRQLRSVPCASKAIACACITLMHMELRWSNSIIIRPRNSSGPIAKTFLKRCIYLRIFFLCPLLLPAANACSALVQAMWRKRDVNNKKAAPMAAVFNTPL